MDPTHTTSVPEIVRGPADAAPGARHPGHRWRRGGADHRHGLPWLERWVAAAMATGDYAARRMACFGTGIGVLRDTPVLEGAGAVALGRVQTMLGGLLLLCAAGLLGLGGLVVVALWP